LRKAPAKDVWRTVKESNQKVNEFLEYARKTDKNVIDVQRLEEEPTVWTSSNIYKVNCNIRTPDLTIEAGTLVLMGPNACLMVSRSQKLRILGSKTSPVVFVPSTPGGTWGGLLFYSGASADIQFAHVYGGNMVIDITLILPASEKETSLAASENSQGKHRFHELHLFNCSMVSLSAPVTLDTKVRCLGREFVTYLLFLDFFPRK
jgi:hypothetical protein